MSRTLDASLPDLVRYAAHPLADTAERYDRLMELIGDSRLVLLGEATHGTHEFYYERARITQRLVIEKGFSIVAVEADWPDAARVNRYVRGVGPDPNAFEALADFTRFPTWMWRNTDVVFFVTWLRARNDAVGAATSRVGFYGLDLYSLQRSMEAVLRYLERVDPEAAKVARARYACFDQFRADTRVYGFLTGSGVSRSCADDAVSQLVDLQRRRSEAPAHGGAMADDDLFEAEQNARVVKNAEEYYRSVFLSNVSSWNLRDRHMAETLEGLIQHRQRGGAPAKVVVWAHNSHLGDARATEMGQRGELNVGQLVRERYGGDAVLVGFTTHHGTVTAASDWDGPAERKRVRPALPGSYETTFHSTRLERFLLPCRDHERLPADLRRPQLERAIGVVYRPDTERMSHYFRAWLPEQFDAVLHFDETTAVEPLERTAQWDTGELPETYPFAV